MNRTDRLYALVEELRAVAPRRRTARQLAARFEMSVRTIERDIDALQQAGVPIYADTGRGGGYAIDAARTLPPLNFTPQEATAIAAALGAGGAAPFGRATRSALRKVLAAMPSGDAAEAHRLAGDVWVLKRFGPQARPVPAVIEDALLDRRVLRIRYTDRGGAGSEREVEPVAFVAGVGHWYLMGWCRLRDAPRAFRLDRIESATALDEPAPDRPYDEVAPRVPDLVAHALRLD